jgi:hypothetical protein
MSNVSAPAPEIAAAPLASTASCARRDARATFSNRSHRRRIDWFTWLLVWSVLVEAIVAASSMDLLPPSLSRMTALAKQRLAAAVTSIGHSRPGGEANSRLLDRPGMVEAQQSGPVNQPVPLGLSISGDPGIEIVVLDGFAEGTELSTGTRLSSRRWSLPAKDLETAFVGPPKDFIGTMQVTAKLYSSSDELLQTTTIRLGWAPRPADETVGSATPSTVPTVQPAARP